MSKRKRYTAAFKAQVALEAIKGQQTINEIASAHGVHPSQVTQWKKQALEGAPTLFASRGQEPDAEEIIAQLYQEIGRLTVELDWMKKNLGLPVEGKRRLIEPALPEMSMARQCALLGLSRSSYYYKPASASAEELALLRLIDEQYTRTPFYGVRRMTVYLRSAGSAINHKRVARLMRTLGLEGIAPGPKTSRPHAAHRVYPYLLRGMEIERPNQAWGADITYIRLRGGFVYLVAVLDWWSRCVLSWEVSNTLDGHFCLSALSRALQRATPEIMNTDQGAQFTSADFTGRLEEAGVRISMDGRGRALDNVFVERLWLSVKYEEVYLKDYPTIAEAVAGPRGYFRFYNEERPHQALGYRTPAAVYRGAAGSVPAPAA